MMAKNSIKKSRQHSRYQKVNFVAYCAKFGSFLSHEKQPNLGLRKQIKKVFATL